MSEQSKHPNWDSILETLETGSRGDAGVLEHLAACSACAGTAGRIRDLLDRLSDACLPAPPEAWIREALARVREESQAETSSVAEAIAAFAGRIRDGLDQLAAVLVGDSLVPSLAVRGTAQASPRVLVYETDRHSISLSLRPAEEGRGLELSGQIMPKEGAVLPTGGRALLACRTGVEEATLSEFGEFAFRDLRTPVHRLAIEIGEVVVQVGPLDHLQAE